MPIALSQLPTILKIKVEEIENEARKEIVKKYVEKTKHIIKYFYVISGIKPTNYSGSVYPRSGLYKSWEMYNNVKDYWLKDNPKKGEIFAQIRTVEYAEYLINMKEGKYNFLPYVINEDNLSKI